MVILSPSRDGAKIANVGKSGDTQNKSFPDAGKQGANRGYGAKALPAC